MFDPYDALLILSHLIRGKLKATTKSSTEESNRSTEPQPCPVHSFQSIAAALKHVKDNTVIEHDKLVNYERELLRAAQLIHHMNGRKMKVMVEGVNLDSVEDMMSFITTVISNLEGVLGVDTREILTHELKDSHISEVLYYRSAFGALEYPRVSYIPSFSIRGKSYMTDGKKIASRGSFFTLRAIQMIAVEELRYHVAQESWCLCAKHPTGHHFLVTNFMIPGNPPVQVVAVFCATKEAHSVLASNSGEVCASGERAAALTLLKTFWDSAANASDAENNFCDERCKLIPSIEEGGWAIKMAVGQKPVLLGKKIHQAYHRGSNYLEIDIDISSSTIASNILGMVRGVSKDMVVDLGITIQGESEEELPEVMLCQARFDHIDMQAALSI